MIQFGFYAQVGFQWNRGVIGGLFTTFVGLPKRKEHGLVTWALFIDRVEAFDTVPREALFTVLLWFGLPDHFVKVLMRLRFGAKVKVKICEWGLEVDSTTGVRQGSCEGPVLLLFIMQVAMETLQWPGGVARPEFKSAKTALLWVGIRTSSGTPRSLSSRPPSSRAISRFASTSVMTSSRAPTTSFLIFASLVLKCTLVAVPRHPQPRRCTFHLHVMRARLQATSRFLVDRTGFVELSESFKYFGSIIHYFPTSDAGRAENYREVAPGRSVTSDSARSADFDSARSAVLILIPRAARALTPRTTRSVIPRAARRGFDSARSAGFDSPCSAVYSSLVYTPHLQRK
jgi:hypothetical protein